MLETSARLLDLLSLFQARRYWSGQELAARLEITTRTLRRDVDKLRSLGYPVQSTSGTEGGYQLGAGSAMPPLLLNDEETVAVSLGLRHTATGAIAGVEDASVRALAKIEQLLPPRLRRRVEALQAIVVTPAPANDAVDSALLSALAGACRDFESLRFRYSDFSGKPTSRSVEPHRLVHTGRRWYLVAWDANRDDWRTFRLDRIQGRLTTGPRFLPRDPPSGDLAAYVTRGQLLAPPCRARVKLPLDAKTAIARLPPFGLFEPIDDASCFFEMAASSFETLAVHLSLLGVDFQADSPPELLVELRKLSERLGRAVSAG